MALQDSTNPLAGVSGPGSFSKRTDLEYQSPEYGAGKEYDATKSAAPLERAAQTPRATSTEVRQAAASATAGKPIGLFDGTQQKDVPIEDGIDTGPGRGASALGMTPASGKLSDSLAPLLPFDTTGEITILYQMALSRGQ